MRPFTMRLALLVARRKTKKDDMCSAEQDGAITTIIRSRKGLDELCTVVDEYAAASGERMGSFQDILSWIIENWDTILEMIMAIIGLFALDEDHG